jgi:hypothetical protein
VRYLFEMKEIQINKKVYKLPTDYSEVKIYQFQEISKLPAYDANEPEQELEYFTNVLSILMNCEPEVFDFLIGEEFNKIKEYLKFLYEDVSKEAIKNSMEIIIEGKQYYFDFNLFSKQNKAQWIDTIAAQRGGKSMENLHQLMAIMIRPVTGKKFRHNKLLRLMRKDLRQVYDDITIEPYSAKTKNERAELFQKHLTMEKALLLLFFCLNFNLEYTKNSLSSSQNQLKT